MSKLEKSRLPLRQRIKRELTWLKEDLIELRDKIPGKYYDMAGFAVLYSGYMFIFEERARNRPDFTILTAVLASWAGCEAAILIARLIKRRK